MENQENRERGRMEPIGDILKRLQTNNTAAASPQGLESRQSEEVAGTEKECPICKGGRMIHPLQPDGRPDFSRVVPCECIRVKLEAERQKVLLKKCELPRKALSWTFETFELFPGLEEAYEAATDIAERRGDNRWLLLMGGTDRGKSHLLTAICHRWLQAGIPARYAYVPLLFDELRRGFRGEGDNSYDARFDFCLNVPLLALDDLGVENQTPWVQERLDTVIDYRLMHELHLVVTTNLPMEDLPFRIRSRLAREGRVIYVATEEYHERPDRRSG